MTTPFPFVAGAVLTAAQLNAITELIINDKTASYTLVAGDAGEYVVMNSASATTITVNNSLFSAGQVIYIVNKGTASTVITAGAGVTISTSGSLTVPANGSGRLLALSASAFIYEAGGITSSPVVVQMKSTSKTDVFTMTSSTFADVTGLSVSITPTSASNNVLVIASVTYAGLTSTTPTAMRLMRGSTAIAIGDAAGTRTRASSTFFTASGSNQQSGSTIILDSPATTSATTYKVQIASLNTGNTSRVNGTADDSDDPTRARTFSSITAIEVTP